MDCWVLDTTDKQHTLAGAREDLFKEALRLSMATQNVVLLGIGAESAWLHSSYVLALNTVVSLVAIG